MVSTPLSVEWDPCGCVGCPRINVQRNGQSATERDEERHAHWQAEKKIAQSAFEEGRLAAARAFSRSDEAVRAGHARLKQLKSKQGSYLGGSFRHDRSKFMKHCDGDDDDGARARYTVPHR